MLEMEAKLLEEVIKGIYIACEEKGIQEKFVRMLFKHNVYVSQAVHSYYIGYDISQDAHEYVKRLDRYIKSLKESLTSASDLTAIYAGYTTGFPKKDSFRDIVKKMDTHRLYMFIKETNELLSEGQEGEEKKLYDLKEVQDILGIMDIKVDEGKVVVENTIEETCSQSIEELEDVKTLSLKDSSFIKLIQDKLKGFLFGASKTLVNR